MFPKPVEERPDPNGIHGFHADLPYPLNVEVIKVPEGQKQQEIYKVKTKFSGQMEDYLAFRTHFINTIHFGGPIPQVQVPGSDGRYQRRPTLQEHGQGRLGFGPEHVFVHYLQPGRKVWWCLQHHLHLQS